MLTFQTPYVCFRSPEELTPQPETTTEAEGRPSALFILEHSIIDPNWDATGNLNPPACTRGPLPVVRTTHESPSMLTEQLWHGYNSIGRWKNGRPMQRYNRLIYVPRVPEVEIEEALEEGAKAIRLLPDIAEDLKVGRRLRARRMFETHGDAQYRSWKK